MARHVRRHEYVSPAAVGAVAVALTVIVVRYPDHAFAASLAGLRLWFEVVLPALLPFFVLSEILLGLGVIRAVGVLLEPLMRPLFRIPGEAAFTLAMGLASGYPLGAKLTARMRQSGICTREESERLLAFANTADPLFMVGAVAFGMFGAASLGVSIAVAHYAAAFIVGLLLRFHAGGIMRSASQRGRDAGLRRALDALVEARRQDGRPIGTLFSDAVKDAVASLLFIGGTIMMFSVFIRILEVSGIGAATGKVLGALLGLVGLDAALGPALVTGVMEITLGAQSAAKAQAALLDRLIVTGFIIGWSGLSVHAQVAAMVHGTDIRLTPYLAARLVHGILAAFFTWALHPVLSAAAVHVAADTLSSLSLWQRLVLAGGAAGAVLGGLCALAIVVRAVRRVRVAGFRV